MKSLLIFIFLCGSLGAQARVIATYTYLKSKKPVTKNITLKELKSAYDIIKQNTFMAPGPEKFFNDYLRFKLGTEVALHEKSLVKNPNIDRQIVNPFLKQSFHQELYKALAELKLRKPAKKLEKTAANFSEKDLKRIYNNEPEFNIFYIAINLPLNPSPQQINEAEKRAKKIYSQILKSKKPFLELVTLYSDDKVNGTLNINRSRASIPPEVYTRLKSMKKNSISPPIRVPSGYFIVKLNNKLPFSLANQDAIRQNYFNERHTRNFNNYFDSLKKDFKVNIVNKSLIKTL